MSMISVVLNVSNEGIKDGLFKTDSKRKFRSAELIVEFFLDASAPPLGLRATLNPLCAEPPSNLFVQGLFGIRQAPNKECIYLQSSTQSFADSDTVFIELNLVLKSEQYEYCARGILNGRENTVVDGKYTGGYLTRLSQ
jgi:hypothetical protein